MKAAVADTSIISRIFNERPEIALYHSHLSNALISISFQTVAEMRYGAVKADWGSRRRQELERFLESFSIVEYTSVLADKWAIIMDEARQARRRLESGDAWIAATALLLNVPLIAHDNDLDPEACPSLIIYNYVRNTGS